MNPLAIQGYYKSWPSPLPALYVETRVRVPRLGATEAVEFLIDTGADFTCLHAYDAGRLGISPDQTQGDRVRLAGVGGSLEYYWEDATLQFIDGDGLILAFYCRIYISQDPAVAELPSLLGRDFLNCCSLLADNPENQVLVTPAHIISGVILPA